MNKKLFATLLFASLIVPTLNSCNASKNDGLDDKDFDGLINSIDPDPYNNEYKVNLVNRDKEADPYESGELDLTMDYRYFIDHKYNKNLAKLASFCINEASSNFIPNFKNNRYPKYPEKPLICPILTQIGCDNIMKLQLNNSSNIDKYDNAILFVGHHTFSLVDNTKYQIFFILINPYINSSGWASNLDIGAAYPDGTLTEGYIDFAGEEHPDWKDKMNHKGFDVTSNRVFNKIKEYEQSYINKDAHQITFITGHSRGGAITNLVAKMMIDEGFDVRAYAFNPPNNTQYDESITKNSKYDDIHNFINKDDVVSLVPSSQWGFRIFGKNIYKIDVDKELFSNFTKKDYEANSQNALTKLDDLLVNLTMHDGVPSRENIYEFREEDPLFEEAFLFTGEGHKEAADKYYNGLSRYFEHSPEARKSFKYDEPIYEEDTSKILFKTKPSLIIAMVLDIAGRGELSSIIEYIDVSKRLLAELLDYFYDLDFGEFTISAVKTAHEQPIACVMAEQYIPD